MNQSSRGPRTAFVDQLTATAVEGGHGMMVAPLGWGKTESLRKAHKALKDTGLQPVFMDLFTAASTPERLLVALAESVRPAMEGDGEIDRLSAEGLKDRQTAPAALLAAMNRIAGSGAVKRISWLIDEVTEIRSLAYFPDLGKVEKPLWAMVEAGHSSILTSSYIGLAEALFPNAPVKRMPGLGALDLHPSLLRSRARRDLEAALSLTGGGASSLLPLLEDMEQTGDLVESATRLLQPGASLETSCRLRYDILLMRSRGYAVSKRAAEVAASTRTGRLTDLAPLIGRTPGASRQYLRWLVEVGLLVQVRKRYDFADPFLGLWAGLYLGRADYPTTAQIAKAIAERICQAAPVEPDEALREEARPPVRRPDRFEEID